VLNQNSKDGRETIGANLGAGRFSKNKGNPTERSSSTNIYSTKNNKHKNKKLKR